MTTLSIVVPCYNEEEVLPETCDRLLELVERLIVKCKIDRASRIYFVDDGSRDRTWSLIESTIAAGQPVVGIKLSRNSGHQNAVVAGLFTAAGDAVVSIDADLQDDPNAIEIMIDCYHEGCEVVYGVRRSRETDTFFKRYTAECFYRLIKAMGAGTVFNHADYRLLSRRAIESLREYPEVNLFLRGIIPLLGYKSVTVDYDRGARFAGQSKYPLRKMLALALEATTSFSLVPMRMVSLVGIFIFFGSMAVTGWATWVSLFTDRAVPGWASTVLPLYFLGGIQLLALGVIGEYVGKTYLETKRRPRYFIELIAEGESAISRAARPHDVCR
jgi:glycosyltransferase involved in cell wall biosynthesis